MVLYYRYITKVFIGESGKIIGKYEEILLTGWEDIFKKSQLTLWLLLSLKDSPKYVGLIETFIANNTQGTISADTQSLYRALRRLADGGMVSFEQEPTTKGPDRKVYSLTSTGGLVLQRFLQRNIINVLYKPSVEKLIRREI